MESKTRGVWGVIARPGEDRGALARALVDELERGLAVLKTLPPAVTFFGGARIKEDDPAWADAERLGALLAEAGIPPRTGAGPGIMTAVPRGFRRRLRELSPEPLPPEPGGAPRRMQALTQGFNIELPFEEAVNPAIDVAHELSFFPTRKLMLHENSRGIVIFPGGFGTLDEMFEVWRLESARRLRSPFVLWESAFWAPIVEVLRETMLGGRRTSVPRDAFDLPVLSDEPAAALQVVTQDRGPAFDEPPEELGRRMARELVEGLDYLERLGPAVTVLGGTRLREDDPAVPACEEVARRLALHEIPTRAGGPGPFSAALARGGHRGSRYLPQQAFAMRREDARNLFGADRVHLVNDRLTHKLLLTENSLAVVAVPGGLGTIDELFSVLCQVQTGKIARRPIVLWDRDFWGPLWKVLREQMLEGRRRTISPGDLDLVTITDDPEEVAARCLQGLGG